MDEFYVIMNLFYSQYVSVNINLLLISIRKFIRLVLCYFEDHMVFIRFFTLIVKYNYYCRSMVPSLHYFFFFLFVKKLYVFCDIFFFFNCFYKIDPLLLL